MRVGLNGLLLSREQGYRRTGINRYLEALARHLPAALGEADELIVFGRNGTPVEGMGAPRLVAPPVPLSSPPARILWEQTGLAVQARMKRLDLFHGPVNALPRALTIPAVVTIHDLAFLEWPEHVTRRRYLYLRSAVRHAAKSARLVITPSEATKAEVVSRLNADPERVVVIPLAASRAISPAAVEEVTAVRARHGLLAPYILYVGTLEPRKNLVRLIRAFTLLATGGPAELELALVGPIGWRTEELLRAVEESPVRSRIRQLGFVEDEDLAALYTGAAAVAIPSISEGFGLPVLEAMAAGGAVLTSKVSSLPEVAGDAAYLVDPLDEGSIAAGLRRLLEDVELNERLREIGPKRAAEFSWEWTAQLTVEAYRRALEMG